MVLSGRKVSHRGGAERNRGQFIERFVVPIGALRTVASNPSIALAPTLGTTVGRAGAGEPASVCERFDPSECETREGCDPFVGAVSPVVAMTESEFAVRVRTPATRVPRVVQNADVAGVGAREQPSRGLGLGQAKRGSVDGELVVADVPAAGPGADPPHAVDPPAADRTADGEGAAESDARRHVGYRDRPRR